MSNLKRLLCRSLVAILAFSWSVPVQASAYDAHPKLVILLIIDQFRADYLDRYSADFKGRGFRLFLDHGAYFEDCYYDYANTETAPGHATLATGAYTDGHGIASNAWWDLSRNKTRPISSVEDERYHIVGPANTGKSLVGASPLNLRASTIGDSLRLATQGQSKVFGISLKDRAAILASGYSANGAYWIDPASGAFITSSYYMNNLPDWVTDFNESGRIAQAEEEAGTTDTTHFYQSVGGTPAANSYELDFARALITSEQLGQHPVTDMLMISLSANDLLGHRVGPDSPEEREMVDDLDQQLGSFFGWLDKNIPGGLEEVWIAFSADHGVAPVPLQAIQLGLPAATFDIHRFSDNLNEAMNAKFSPGEKIEYLLPRQTLPYIELNRPAFEVAGINEQEGEQAIQQAVPAAVAALPFGEETALPDEGGKIASQSSAGDAENLSPNAAQEPSSNTAQPSPGTAKQTPSQSQAAQPSSPQSSPQPPSGTPQKAVQIIPLPPQPLPPVREAPKPIVVRSYTREQLAAGALPPSEWGLLLAHSYSSNGGWYVMVIPAAYQIPALGRGTTHFSPWSYDRHVPLGFYGAPFKPGIYHGRVEPVDLAATLASLLGVNQPSASVGRILTEAIHNVPAAPSPRSGTRSRHHAVPAHAAPGTEAPARKGAQ